ncbi:unnamed protein product [Prorocentrum cordatum]|uniref:Uncharacterized protein n=1 Tax=Prorocentrum cordatum TaxID=2364126 RepID=A0ABN9TQ13_9DINO|nr:unnamed protein product [Polarella glacialis]
MRFELLTRTCSRVHDGGDGGDLAPELLGDLLSRGSTVRSLFDSLGLGLRGGGVTCRGLSHSRAGPGGLRRARRPAAEQRRRLLRGRRPRRWPLPTAVAVEGEEAECNVGVGPHDMAKGSKELKEADPDVPIDQSGEPAVDGGERAAQGRLAAALRTAGAAVVAYDSAPGQRHVVRKVEPRTPHSGRREAASRDAALSAPQRYDVVHQVACRVANIFRFFPSCEAVTVTIEPKSVGDRLSTNESRRIRAAGVAAAAWRRARTIP